MSTDPTAISGKKDVDPTWLARQLGTATWQTSSYSSGGTNCIQIAFLPHGLVALRDSKNLDQPAHLYTDAEYDAFVKGIVAGQLRRP